ncbi:hypothetical protein T08_4528 [Trichinella sp. T8]|nr:hypothetical protein T08_4528 [Trichinella sp. T8]
MLFSVVRQPSEERWVAERHKAARRCRNEWQRQRQQAWRNGSSTCCTCNGPLPRAGSFASSTGLLTRPSLFGDGPVLTGAFPFRSVSRFPDGIATTKQQAISIYFIRQSETRIDDDVNTNTLANTDVNNHYRTLPPIFMSYFSYGSFSFLRLHFLQERSH